MQLATRRWRETPLTVVLLVLLGLLSTLFLTQTTPGWLSPSFGSSSLPRLQPYNCVDGASITSTLNDDNITIDYGPWTEFSSLVESRRKSFQPLLSKVIYRVAMCTITRNELHLKEWLVRNTLMGFEHFFIFDTNQVDLAMDIDIRPTIRPFQDLGLITHVRVPSNTTQGPVSTAEKNAHIGNCLRTYGHLAEWLAYFDSDEIIQISPSQLKDNSNEINPLYKLLETAAATKQPDPPGVYVRWMMPYPEALLLKPKQLLMDAYPRACVTYHSLGKNIVRPSRVQVLGDHTLEGQWANDVSAETVYLGLIHYYAKSVEEFLVKKEQSWTEFERVFVDAYDWSKWSEKCTFEHFEYYPPYANATRRVMGSLRKIPDAGIALTAPWNKALRKAKDWNLYMFLKWIVAMRYEWSDKAYLALHSDVAEGVSKGDLTDGWWHFISKGFAEDYRGCWKPPDGAPILCF